jgi:Transmembrane protein 43
MSDQFREVTTKSWLSRIMGSFIGVLVGILLFLGAFPLIFWNEGRSVDRIKTLGEGRSLVVELSADQIDSAQQGALIHFSGLATTDDVLKDSQFGVEENALKLNRLVEMYQWEETSESKTIKNLGGSETTETVYSYNRTWSQNPINSSNFKNRFGHENPSMPAYGSEQFTASKVTVGAFELGAGFVGQISGAENYPLSQKNYDALDSSLRSSFKMSGSTYFRGNVSNPQVGAVRISYKIVRPMTVSVVGKQDGATLQSYATKNGEIELLQNGTLTAADMFASAEAENKIITWLIRLAGFIIMWFGLALIMGPLSVIGSVIPFVGSVLGAGTGFIAFVLALVLSVVTAAIAWIVFRPLIGGALLLLAVLFFFCGFKWLRGKAEAAAAAPAASGSKFGRQEA